VSRPGSGASSSEGRRSDRVAEWLLIGDAIERILQATSPVAFESVPLLDAGGRVLAEPAVASLTMPPWNNSGMDGYACCAADVARASHDVPVTLRVIGGVVAGGFPDRSVGAGEAYRIMTGAPLPSGADTVIRVEHTRIVSPDVIEVFDAMDTRKNIRFAGEDFRTGDNVLPAGVLLRPAEVGVLASIGMSHPRVARRPRVAILSTGDELADLDGLPDAIAGRRIINSNSYALAAGVRATGCEPVLLGIARDDAADLRAKLEGALDCDALITTAGASVGEHDLVKDALESIGMRVDFWRVKMRPGSPFSFGMIERSASGLAPLPVFGLPGNPVSAVVTFEVLERPALRRMQGRTAVHAPVVRVRTAELIESKPGMTHFLRVVLAPGADGVPEARLTGPQGSGILTSVARADALLVVPLDVTEIAAGADAAAVLLQAGDDAQLASGF
jgi:molybdopterin molybdotransferase